MIWFKPRPPLIAFEAEVDASLSWTYRIEAESQVAASNIAKQRLLDYLRDVYQPGGYLEFYYMIDHIEFDIKELRLNGPAAGKKERVVEYKFKANRDTAQ